MDAQEQHRRSGVKALTYRLLGISVDSCVAYFFTRDASLSAMIVLLVNGYSTLLYYLHERVWAHISWGQKPVPASVSLPLKKTPVKRKTAAKKTTVKTVRKKKEVASTTSDQ